jgi:uncharacterized protein (DUF488 family)
MAQSLLTIGYEGRTMDEFLAALTAAGAQTLIDVRAVAASRRPGFSKTALAGALREVGIDYLHLRPLGTPKEGREAARKGRVAEMRAIFAEQLATPEAQLALLKAEAEATGGRAALLCFERDATCCHRAMVAEELVRRRRFEVIDL